MVTAVIPQANALRARVQAPSAQAAGEPRSAYVPLELLALRGWRIEIVRAAEVAIYANTGWVALSARGATIDEATRALLAQVRRALAKRPARRAVVPFPASGDPAEEVEAEQRPGPRFSRDLRIAGLPARQAARLRNALARAGVPIDDEAEGDVMAIVARRGGSGTTLERVLSVISRWARISGFTQLPIVYGGNAYTLTVEGDFTRDNEREAADTEDRPRRRQPRPDTPTGRGSTFSPLRSASPSPRKDTR